RQGDGKAAHEPEESDLNRTATHRRLPSSPTEIMSWPGGIPLAGPSLLRLQCRNLSDTASSRPQDGVRKFSGFSQVDLMPAKSGPAYEFGPFCLDPAERLLLHGGR